MRTKTLAGMLTGLLLATGCAAGNQVPSPVATIPEAAGNLEVINRSSLDMDVYLVRSNGQRNRIGLAPGSKTTRFALTPAQVAGVGPVTFEAVPTLRGGRGVSSDQVNVTPREVITLDIPPQ
jgi:hypothetical protein